MKKKFQRMVWGEDPQFSGPRDWFRNSQIISQVQKTSNTNTVLDFGCGSGHLISRIADLGYKCFGVDESKPAIDYAVHTYPRVIFKKAGIDYLLNTPNRFDMVVSGEVIEHIKDDKKLVKGFYRVLRPGGCVVVSTPAHMQYWDINDDFSSHFRRYEVGQLRDLFEASGFKEVYSSYWGWPLTFYWHKYIYLPLIENKIKKGVKYTGSQGLLGKVLKNSYAKALVSNLFFLDNLFNWTKLGGGIIGVYKKANGVRARV